MSVEGSNASRAPVKAGDVLAGKYVVERVLGVGGMGVVVAARHQLLGGRVALKFVLPELSNSGQVVERFIKEAQAATRIASEHVARVTDVGTLDGNVPFMVMEFLEGRDLGSLIEESGPLPLPVAVDYLLQGLQAVAEAHAKGIVHRDLKPSNLFLTKRPDGTPLVKVLDFGIAKAVRPEAMGSGSGNDLTGTNGTVGSPLYMSPEQIRSARSVDARSDVWAAGVILFELLTQRHPFIADSVGALLAAVLTEPPASLRALRPDLPADVERAILACLEKDVGRRMPSVATLAVAIARFGTADASLSLSRIRGIAGADSGALPVLPLVNTAAVAVTAPAYSFSPSVPPSLSPNPPTGAGWSGTSPGGNVAPARGRGRSVALALGFVVLAAGAGAAFLVRGRSVELEVNHGLSAPIPALPAPSVLAAPEPLPSVSAVVAATPEPAPAASSAPPPPSAVAPKAPAPRTAARRPPTAPKATAAPVAPAATSEAAAAPAKPARAKGALDGLIDQR